MKNNIRAIIVDDEQFNRELLDGLIKTYVSEIEVLKSFDNLLEAVEYLNNDNIDLVFLDIEMPINNGLELFDLCGSNNFDVIIVSAYDKYAIPAIKEGVFDYLLKPVDIAELKKTIVKLQSHHKENNRFKSVKLFDNGIIIKVVQSKIIMIQAEGSYSNFFLINGLTTVQSRNLAYFTKLIQNANFVRIHRSSIVNVEHVISINKKESLIELANGHQVKYSKKGGLDLIQVIDL